METTNVNNAEIRELRRELASLRSDFDAMRLRQSVNAMMINLALWTFGIGTIFVVAMKVT